MRLYLTAKDDLEPVPAKELLDRARKGLVTVLDVALRAYQAAGIDAATARALAGPLAAETLANVLRLGAPAALSGPIARGDMATVARQQAAVGAWDGAAGALYEALVAPTVALAERKHRKDAA